MKGTRRTGTKSRSNERYLSPHHQRERKQRVLTKRTPSLSTSIAHAIVLKDENIFFLAPTEGSIPHDDGHGFGLYYHDCRYLSGYEMRIGDVYPEVLTSSAEWGYKAVFQLTNPDIRTSDETVIPKETIGIKWERLIESDQQSFHDGILFENFGHVRADFSVSLAFKAGFEDVFTIRGAVPEKVGTFRRPIWKNGVLWFRYDGADGVRRSLAIHFAPAPEKARGSSAVFRVALQPEERLQIVVSLVLVESDHAHALSSQPHPSPDFGAIDAALGRASEEWMRQETQIRSDSLVLDRVIHRSLIDLRVLKTTLNGHSYFAGGVPWFVALFGRDSLVAALQTLAYDQNIAEHTLRLLADYQGQRMDAWRDEQPGKILHELRVGEMARRNEIPQTPYYGAIDATMLFLILLGRHASWTGALTLFRELRTHVEAALEWMTRYGDQNGDGYINYHSSSEKGLVNQGWKDSGDAIVNADGSQAVSPISLVEVQGYAYLAKMTIADLYRRDGDQTRADRLLREAEDLRSRFNRDFWVEEKGFFALALQADHRPCAVISSNPGQALWTGIVDSEKAAQTVTRLMADDMFNGWGVRTLSETERRYNPIGYHLGTVWPHDNSLIAAGFRRYGFDQEARRIVTGIVEAALHFEHQRLPEVFAGFPRRDYEVPVRYPVACHPQAWAAGSVPYLMETCLGICPEAFEHRLRIVRPLLPPFTHQLEIHGLSVGGATADVRFERREKETVGVDVLKIDGELDIVVESAHGKVTGGEHGSA